MKRIHSACLLQTLHFMLDPNVEHDEAIKKVNLEVINFKNSKKDSMKILSETKLDDGSYILKLKKKVSGYSVGNYFDE